MKSELCQMLRTMYSPSSLKGKIDMYTLLYEKIAIMVQVQIVKFSGLVGSAW